MGLTVAQAAQRSGLTAHTLRYYDKEGLLPFVGRTPGGSRNFQEGDFEWLSVITCLKSTGMQIRDIRQFIDWCMEGDATLGNRLELFRRQKELVEEQIRQMHKHMEKIQHKISYYETACAAGTEAVVKGRECGSLFA